VTLTHPVPYELALEGHVLRFENVVDHGTHVVVTTGGEPTVMSYADLLAAIRDGWIQPKVRAILHVVTEA
jgi:hypothetical protein